MTRFARFFACLLLALAIAGIAGNGLACSGASGTTGIPSVTGIIVRAETLTEGKGCGRAPTQVFKYAAVVFGGRRNNESPLAERSVITTNIYDCFSDGTFVDLPPVAGSTFYDLEIYVYNEASFSLSSAVIKDSGRDLSTVVTILEGTSPTWTTRCTATQQPDVQSLALCDPLSPGLGGVGRAAGASTIALPSTTSFPVANGEGFCIGVPRDGGTDAPIESGVATDASADAGDAGDAGDASDAGVVAEAGPSPSDAGAKVEVAFKTARINWRTSSRVGPTVDVTCPDAYRVTVDAEPAAYVLDVALLDGAGNQVGASICEAVTRPGGTTTAICRAP